MNKKAFFLRGSHFKMIKALTLKKENKNKPKVNSLRPCMREKKRYLAFEVITDKPFQGEADRILIKKINEILGVFNSAKAGLMRVNYDQKSQRGLIRVDRSFVDHIRTCFVMIKHLNNQPVLLRTLKVSGMLNKAGECIKLNRIE